MDNQLDTNVLLLKIEHLEQLNKFLLEQKEMSEIRLKQQIGMYKMTLDFFTNQNQSPDSIFVQHHTVNFTISLKQLYASE